jgi:hypothetical protein
MVKCPERRVSVLSDRRRVPRGGRRHGDQPVSYPSSVLPCPACLTGMADIAAVSPDGDTRKLMYRCSGCDHQFDQDAEPLAPLDTSDPSQ